tara:strand:- start:2806 stop:3990 length:1185 start_codon:yes stop_codon:yes gene_type:complete
MATPDDASVVLQGQFLPEFQENFLKNLLANIYRVETDVDEFGQPVERAAGIAAVSPLFGRAQFDEQGRPVFKTDPQTGEVLRDQFGQPIQEVVGGVPRPDIVQFTPAQKRAIELGIAGIGAYEPMLEQATKTVGRIGDFAVDPATGETVSDVRSGIGAFERGLDTLTGTTGAFDPKTAFKDFYDPFVEDVIDTTIQDIEDAGKVRGIADTAQAIRAGAFGGAREGVQRAELQEGLEALKAETRAKLRSDAFRDAQTRAMNAFENQQKRGQTASQIFGQLGRGIANLGVTQGSLGEAAQAAAQRDVDALFNLGTLEQTQRQAELDVQRQAAGEEAFEPFQRFEFMSNILRGIPSPQSKILQTVQPPINPLANILAGGAALGGTNILGGLVNRGGG